MATESPIVPAMRIRRLFFSPGHNFKGRHGTTAENHPIVEVPSIRCVAGQGIEGDRWFGHKPDFKGQITFFDWAVYEELQKTLRVLFEPSVFRRNVLVAGADLNRLVGIRFELQGVCFEGTEECSPCYWMEQAVAPGAETAMKGRGGLRARILTSGLLEVDGD